MDKNLATVGFFHLDIRELFDYFNICGWYGRCLYTVLI